MQNRILLILGVIFLFAGVVTFEEFKLNRAKRNFADLQQEFTQYKLNAEEAKANALIEAAEETERRLETQRRIVDDYSQKLEKLRGDFANANAVSQRLRERIQTLTSSSRQNSTINSTSAGIGETKSTTERIGELAAMADAAAGKLAQELDDAIARGKACETMYQDLSKGKPNDRP